MSNDYWKEFKRLVKRAEKASGGNSATEYRVAYVLMQQYVNSHSPAPESADARIAELERECSQWRDELRIYRETENKRIAELEQSVTVRDTEIARLETDLELARMEVKSLEEHLHALVEVSDDSTIARARAVLNGDDIGEDEDTARAGNGGVV